MLLLLSYFQNLNLILLRQRNAYSVLELIT